MSNQSKQDIINNRNFFIKSWNRSADTTLYSNLDMMIFTNSYNGIEILMMSFCDLAINVRGVVNNLNAKVKEVDDKKMFLNDYNNEKFGVPVNGIYYAEHWNYKVTKTGQYTHGIAHRNKINECYIDWSNEGYAKSIAKYCINKLHIPITKAIIEIIYNQIQDENKTLKSVFGIEEYDVWTKVNQFKNIKCYHIGNGSKIIEILKNNTYDIGLIKTNEENNIWENIKTVNDYLLEFNKEIQEVLNNTITIRFKPETDLPDMNMFDFKRKPYKGQISLIEGAKRTLKDTNKCMLLCEMGVGKTTIATMATDLLFKEKSNNGYLTLVISPNIAVKKWKREVEEILGKKNVNVIIIEKTTDFIKWYNDYLKLPKENIKKPTYIIASMETLKLGYKMKSAVSYKNMIVTVPKEETNSYGGTHTIKSKEYLENVAVCPDCGKYINNINPKKSDYKTNILRKDDFKTIKKSNRFCTNCGSSLWTVDKVKTAKTSLINYMTKKHIRFDMVINDEFHNSRNQGSIIGYATGEAIRLAKYNLLLSGTMNSGKVSSIYPILSKLIGRKLLKDGYGFKDMDKFIKEFGSLEAVQRLKDEELKMTSRTVIRESDFREIPGISPILYTKYLSDIVITAKLKDLGLENLPKYTEYPIYVELDEELKQNSDSLQYNIKKANSFNSAMYENTILHHYINCPFGWSGIPIKDKDQIHIIQPKNLNPNILLNKERKLIEIIKENLHRERKCFVFTNFTGGHSKYKTESEVINDRLCRILKENDINTKCLKANIKPQEREEYINKYSNIDVWITNPILVSVSLDLLNFPSLIFLNEDYEPLKINQTAHRAFRANQTKDCETYYFYSNSIEEKIFKSVLLKIMEAKAIQGEYDIDSFNEIKRTASALGKELYSCISVEDDVNKMNNYNINTNIIKLRPKVENLYK